MQLEIAAERLRDLQDYMLEVVEVWLAGRPRPSMEPKVDPNTVKCWCCDKAEVPADPQHLGCCDPCIEKIRTRKEVPMHDPVNDSDGEARGYPLPIPCVPRDIASAQGESSE
jgi:hypothetical protein